MEPKIQLYLDFLDLKESIRRVEKFSDVVDWIGVSRALINSEGSKSIAKIKDKFPEKKIVADMKAVDISDAEYAIKANADVIVVSGTIDEEDMENCIKFCKEHYKEVMLDLASNHRTKKIQDFSKLKVDYVLLNHDQVKNFSEKSNVPIVVNMPHNHEEILDEVMDYASIFTVNTSTIKREEILKIRNKASKEGINRKMENEPALMDAKLENMKEILFELKNKLKEESENIRGEKEIISAEWEEIRKREEELESEKTGTADKFGKRQEKLWADWEKKQEERWQRQMNELKKEREWIDQEKEKIKEELKRIEDEWTELLEKGKFIEENTMDVATAREFIENEKEAVKKERETIEQNTVTLKEDTDRIAEEKKILEDEWKKLQEKEKKLEIIRKDQEKEVMKRQEALWLEWEEKQRTLLEEEMVRAEKIIDEERKKIAEDKKEWIAEISKLKNERIELKKEKINFETEKARIKKQEEYLQKKEADMQKIMEEKQKIQFSGKLLEIENENKKLQEQKDRLDRDSKKLDEERKSIDLMIASIEEAKYKLNDEKAKIESEREKLEQLNDKVAEELKIIGIENLDDIPAVISKFTELDRKISKDRELVAKERQFLEKEKEELSKEREKVQLELINKSEKNRLDERRAKLENELSAIEKDLMKLKAEHWKTGETRSSSSREIIRRVEKETKPAEVKRVVNKKELINQLIDLVEREERIEVGTAAKKLRVSPELVKRWGAVLKKRYVIDVEKPMVGDMVLKKGMFMHKFN